MGDNIRVRGRRGILLKMKLEDEYSGEGYYMVEIESEGKELVFYAVEKNEISFI